MKGCLMKGIILCLFVSFITYKSFSFMASKHMRQAKQTPVVKTNPEGVSKK
jgi:hypothetical protein